jgi:hypothetical protein
LSNSLVVTGVKLVKENLVQVVWYCTFLYQSFGWGYTYLKNKRRTSSFRARVLHREADRLTNFLRKDFALKEFLLVFSGNGITINPKLSYYSYYLHWYRPTFKINFLYIIDCEDLLFLPLPTLVQTDVQHYFSFYNRVRRFLIIGTTYTGTDSRSRLFFFI